MGPNCDVTTTLKSVEHEKGQLLRREASIVAAKVADCKVLRAVKLQKFRLILRGPLGELARNSPPGR